MRQYPYGLRYATHPDPALQQLDTDVSDLTDCELPYVRADWFIATATRPPLYHILLQLPNNAKLLEKRLRVDFEANFLRDRLARGAFAGSGVSGQNRLVELFADYNSVGITGICDRNCGSDGMAAYQKLLADGKLTVRIAMSRMG